MSNFTQHIPPPCIEDIKIVHVDDHLVVVDKPSGLLSVPGRIVKDCVTSRLAFDFPDVTIVHRLDLDTSGLLVLALTKDAARILSQQFRARAVKKEYVAVVWGDVVGDAGEIDLPLSPDPVNRPRHLVDVENGKSALTRYQVIERGGDRTRMLLKPVTGRSHQLRVHLTHIGHPILGCDLYAHEAAFRAADRLMLHASKLQVLHPAGREPVTFCSEPAF